MTTLFDWLCNSKKKTLQLDSMHSLVNTIDWLIIVCLSSSGKIYTSPRKLGYIEQVQTFCLVTDHLRTPQRVVAMILKSKELYTRHRIKRHDSDRTPKFGSCFTAVDRRLRLYMITLQTWYTIDSKSNLNFITNRSKFNIKILRSAPKTYFSDF